METYQVFKKLLLSKNKKNISTSAISRMTLLSEDCMIYLITWSE